MTISPRRALHHPGVRGGIAIALLSLAVMRAEAQQLRLASASAADASDQNLYLQLVINQIPTDRVVRIQQRDGHMWIAPADLRAVSLPIGASGDLIAVDTMTGVTTTYDVYGQRLLLDVPPHWLPRQRVAADAHEFLPATTSLGALLNYDVQATSSNGGARSVSMFGEQRLFDRWGVVSNIGLFRQTTSPGRRESGYVRHTTSWSYSDEQRLQTYTAGDVVSGSLAWTRAVRFGGFSLERNFSIRPDLITYPLPDFSGEVAVPTSLDLFINGRKATTAPVVPGPFTIDSAPSISGAGTATVVTTDALGRRVSREIPFYIANALLRKGLGEYSISGGLVRRGFGLSSFAYGRPAASGIGRYGVSNSLTLAVHAEGSANVAVAGGGADIQLFRHGVLSVASLASRRGTQMGQEYSAGYSYTNTRFSVNVRRVERSSTFNDLARVESVDRAAPYRSLDQATMGTSLGEHGTVGAGIIRQIRAAGERTNLLHVSYSRRIMFGGSLFVSMNQAVANERGRSVSVQTIFRLGARDTVAAGMMRGQQTGSTPYAQYSRSASPAGGLDVSAGYTGGPTGAVQADASWRTPLATMTAGVRSQDGMASWAGISGSGVVMDRRIFLTNRVHDAFVLIDTDGVGKVPVRFENQVVGETNGSGHLFVPSVASYHPARYEVDPLNLDANVQLPLVEQRVAVRRQSGAIVRFRATRVQAAAVVLVDEQGERLPFGLMVRHLESSQPAVVGWSGIAYFDELSSDNTVEVTRENGTTCTARFQFPANVSEIATLGPVVCR